MEERKSKKIQNRKHNARLYPIYKMCSWDLLFYYAISFVFLVQIKGLEVAQIMLIDAFYPIFKIVLQIPGTAVIDKLGKRKSLIFANLLLALFLVILIFSNGIIHVIFANFILAMAFSIKNVAESNLLYDSVMQKNGKGMYEKLEEKGARNYYYLDGISSLITGFLFVINGYIPMVISLGFTIVAVAISTCFNDIHVKDLNKTLTVIDRVRSYKEELRTAFSFIFKSRRLQALMVFILFFNGLIYICYTLREGLLTQINMPAQYFAVIIASLTFISGMTAKYQEVIHKKLKNRALSFIAVIFVGSVILVGIVNVLPLPFVAVVASMLVLFAVQYGIQSPYYTLKGKYLKSFASPEMRVKIESTAALVISASEMVMALMASFLLSILSAAHSFLVIGGFYAIVMGIVLVWMKPRFGLKAKQYKEKDIEYIEIK